jgi:hypothetical protein
MQGIHEFVLPTFIWIKRRIKWFDKVWRNYARMQERAEQQLSEWHRWWALKDVERCKTGCNNKQSEVSTLKRPCLGHWLRGQHYQYSSQCHQVNCRQGQKVLRLSHFYCWYHTHRAPIYARRTRSTEPAQKPGAISDNPLKSCTWGVELYLQNQVYVMALKC